MSRLSDPPETLVDILVAEDRVNEQDIREFSSRLVGLTIHEGMAYMDHLHFHRKWNMQTYMVAAEILDAANHSTNVGDAL